MCVNVDHVHVHEGVNECTCEYLSSFIMCICEYVYVCVQVIVSMYIWVSEQLHYVYMW